MRRALLLATLLALPMLGRAQSAPSGTITFTVTDADPAPNYINAAECAGPRGTNTVLLNWMTTGSAAAGMSFQLYASNVAFTVGNSGCPTTGTVVGTLIVSVGQVVNKSQQSQVSQPFDPVLIASALAVSNPNPCAIATDTQIYLCMNALSGSTVLGTATGQMTLSTSAPDVAPSMSSIGSGDGALNPSWDSHGSGNTRRYRVQAVSMRNPGAAPSPTWFDPNGGYNAFDPRDTAIHTSAYVTGGSLRLGGLQNGVTYAVAVTGYTLAYNPSTLDATGIGTGTPAVTYDLWEVYKADGGREAGGCSAGLAGPIGLVLAAGALALARRRT